MISNGDVTLYRIGELARLANVSRRTIDFYTRIGLLQPEERSNGNYRLYKADSLERLRYITEMKKKKYTLEEIREQLDLLERGKQEDQLLEKVEFLRDTLSSIEKEIVALRPALQERLKNSRSPEMKAIWQKAMAQGLSLAQTLLLLFDANFFT
ncbi:MerR family transcriptional regulator [Collibacillus ludicampi]|uniref:MerR family transcriptional regulator n=1 Tax=Collibacillus ludicampi TaxID=2771369 RepID=A0AAV4LI73_9BACL|nr:MerR family transcriptional regulator [Collibacillus ludicampi]GIM47157.1 MerR family transcriptional regulator [Collibacillus ludicampi]